MTLVSDIVRQALRETNIAALPQPSSTAETTEGLDRLQALVLSTLGNDVGYIMEDWNVISAALITDASGVPLSAAMATAFVTPPNVRFACGLTAATTLKLDPQPQDGQRFSFVDVANTFDSFALTINPNGRKLEGAVGSAVYSTEGLVRQFMYRSDVADWKKIDTLALGDTFPFPADFDDYFIISLAMRLNPRYAKQLSKESTERLEQQRGQIIARYSQTRLSAAQPAGG